MAGQTKKTVLTDTIRASAVLTANLFVDRDGTLATVGNKPYGVTISATEIGAITPVDVAGITIVTAAGAVAAGDRVQVTAGGKGITQVPRDVNQAVVMGAAAATNIAIAGMLGTSQIIGVIRLDGSNRAAIDRDTVSTLAGNIRIVGNTANQTLLVTWRDDSEIAGIARSAAAADGDLFEILLA